MSSVEKSLRPLVDKWLGGLPEGLARVTGFGHCRRNNWRYVRIETMCSSGARDLLFPARRWFVVCFSARNASSGNARCLIRPPLNSEALLQVLDTEIRFREHLNCHAR